jgi:hypothetical protein
MRKRYTIKDIKILEDLLPDDDINNIFVMNDVISYVEGLEVFNGVIYGILDDAYEDVPLYIGKGHDKMVKWRLYLGR